MQKSFVFEFDSKHESYSADLGGTRGLKLLKAVSNTPLKQKTLMLHLHNADGSVKFLKNPCCLDSHITSNRVVKEGFMYEEEVDLTRLPPIEHDQRVTLSIKTLENGEKIRIEGQFLN